MVKFCYKIDYFYGGHEDFMILSSSDNLTTNQIIDFAVGPRDKGLFEVKEVWELNFNEDSKLFPYSLKTKLF